MFRLMKKTIRLWNEHENKSPHSAGDVKARQYKRGYPPNTACGACQQTRRTVQRISFNTVSVIIAGCTV